MDVLQAMRAFSCVVQAGSLTGAAESLDTTTASVSRMLSNLEAHLHIRLLNRTTRRIALTEAGNRYLKRCRVILELVDTAEREIHRTLDLLANGLPHTRAGSALQLGAC
ncbi:hypothetical protein STW0522PSE72_26850 [Pseudomonas monteilii]|nr:hypothetical protein STW0522PSE72_26850 [Pseudomonas monteilii]